MNTSVLISIGTAIIDALAQVNWASLFPSFGLIATTIANFLKALLGYASAKVAANALVAA